MFRLHYLILLLCCGAIQGLPRSASAQVLGAPPAAVPTTDAPAEDLSPASIQARLKKLDDAKNVEESVREGLVATYKKILLQLIAQLPSKGPRIFTKVILQKKRQTG